MSRRPPNAAQDRAAQNQQTIKTLLKLEANKSCADCKRNKHPRWASWNLGVFVCIRCSGIHRGMGTHISRVKSVDLDAWTDEQMQSILRWGNARANKYWESKLTAGHVPSDAKMENFIRTKYESKRWVMDGPMPNPATLDDDDEVPLNVVQEKARLERASSQRNNAQTAQTPPKAAPQVDLFADVPEPPARPSTTDAPAARAPPPAKAATASKPTKASDSLLGLDFFGAPAPGSAAGNSSAPATSGQPRPDLKQSILSLYASSPKPQPSASGMPGTQSAQQSSAFGGLDDAFGTLSVNSTSQAPIKSDPFANFNSTTTQRAGPAAPHTTKTSVGGGGFFETGTRPVSHPQPQTRAPPKAQASLTPAASNDFGDFSFASSPPASTTKTKTAPVSASNDLFGMDEPAPANLPPVKATISNPIASMNSAFNLSSPAPPPTAPQAKPSTQSSNSSNLDNFSGSDAWGDNAWATPEPAAPEPPKAPAAPTTTAAAPAISMTSDFSGWGGAEPTMDSTSFTSAHTATTQAPPKVMQDEDFGGWSSGTPAAPVASASTPAPARSKAGSGGGGFGGGDDLFSNVWE